jgi:N-acyl amino acid synthase of PEP-CTERM/exosortase system
MTARRTAQHVHARRTGQHFNARSLDDAPGLLEQSYGLRYLVYCLERKFLPAENYPLGLETDDFDGQSVHVGAVGASGELAATARVVNVTATGSSLPLFRHCEVFAQERDILAPPNTVVEISRLAMSRRYRQRGEVRVPERRDVRREVFLTLLKAIYQATKRLKVTHWLAATEESLQRRVEQYGLPFRVIGPESDYSGRVTPYVMSLAEFDKVILSRRIPVLGEFLVGLEPQFCPREDPMRHEAERTSAARHARQASEQLVGTH